MRRTSFSFMELFQDPIFTILALILLATMPMVFPGEGKHFDPQVQGLMEEIKAIEKFIRDHKEIIRQLEQQKKEKEAEYQGLREMKQKKLDSKALEQQQLKTLKDLQNTLAARRREVEKLKAELTRLNSRRGNFAPSGFHALEDSPKKDFYIQLAGNRLYPVDNQHFSARDAYATIAGGKTIPVTVKTRKSKATGDRLEDLGKPGSEIEKVLKKLDARQQRIIFLVQRDSFPIFRRARELVFKRGFECGWLFTSRQEIILGPASQHERLPSTPPPSEEE